MFIWLFTGSKIKCCSAITFSTINTYVEWDKVQSLKFNFPNSKCWNNFKYSTVYPFPKIVTRLWSGQPRNCSLIPGRRKRIFCFPKYPYWIWWPHSEYQGHSPWLESGCVMRLTTRFHLAFGGAMTLLHSYAYVACIETTFHFLTS